jgi:ketosteroid isomerase-like protein
MTRSFAVLLLVFSTAAIASDPPQAKTDDCGMTRVQREIEARYAQLEDANRRKDLNALLALRTKDYIAEIPGGTKNDYAALANYSRAMFEQVQKISTLSNTILKLTLRGDEATATVFQRFSRTQLKAGKLRNVETTAIQDETWLQTPDGWKNNHVFNIHARHWYVDGKRVDPNKPYDPGAPAYNPPIDADE